MEMSTYYNEHDPQAAAWLRDLIADGLIPAGEVDERDIRDVRPVDLAGFTACHFFSGIGGWAYALRLAGWPDGSPVWTGSCPCQPFSAAGRGAGLADERHLWPAWHWLIEQRRPPIVFGEQVASRSALEWFDLVSADLEAAGYAVGAADLCAASVGAPHIRRRLYWVADAGRIGVEPVRLHMGGASSGVRGEAREQRLRSDAGDGSDASRLADAGGTGLEVVGATDGFWRDADWLLCRDPDGPRWRPVEPGTFPLAHGVPARVGRLRGYGNAIAPQCAQAFIEAHLST